MGLLARTLRSFVPGTHKTLASAVPTWDEGRPRALPLSYEVFAREGYSQNEIVFAAVEERATSVAAAQLVAVTGEGDTEEVQENHPAIKLLGRPNQFLSRFDLLAGIEMYLCIAGNAYVEKVYSNGGRLVELWLLRPDRVRVIPDQQKFIAGYVYRIGGTDTPLPARTIIHLRTRNPLDDYYGMSYLAPAARHIDIDNQMALFKRAYFTNAGVPAGLLILKRQLQEGDRNELRQRFNANYGGPGGWHTLGVLDNVGADEVKFERLGEAMGPRGLAVPDLEDINEARIAAPLGVPLSLIGGRLGYASSSYANRVSDREEYTRETVVPQLERICDALTLGLLPEFGGADRITFDRGSLPALQEDEDKQHARVRADVAAGLMDLDEARKAIGLEPVANGKRIFMIPANLVPTPLEQIVVEPDGAPASPDVPVLPEGQSPELLPDEATPSLNGAVRHWRS